MLVWAIRILQSVLLYHSTLMQVGLGQMGQDQYRVNGIRTGYISAGLTEILVVESCTRAADGILVGVRLLADPGKQFSFVTWNGVKKGGLV